MPDRASRTLGRAATMAPMADENATLMWVDEPAIVNAAIAYAYSNIGTATATYVSEMINIMPADG